MTIYAFQFSPQNFEFSIFLTVVAIIVLTLVIGKIVGSELTKMDFLLLNSLGLHNCNFGMSLLSLNYGIHYTSSCTSPRYAIPFSNYAEGNQAWYKESQAQNQRRRPKQTGNLTTVSLAHNV